MAVNLRFWDKRYYLFIGTNWKFCSCKTRRNGILDKIFTRVGATDNISAGESTFMVEMNEAANILNNISEKEVWFCSMKSDVELLLMMAFPLLGQLQNIFISILSTENTFATHYHELNEMSVNFERIKISTWQFKRTKAILFSSKLVSGGSEHSFGIHVAKLAECLQKW